MKIFPDIPFIDFKMNCQVLHHSLTWKSKQNILRSPLRAGFRFSVVIIWRKVKLMENESVIEINSYEYKFYAYIKIIHRSFFRNEISIISFIFKVSAFYTSCNLISVPLMKFEGTLNQIVILNIVNCVLFRMFINVIIFFLF